MARELCPSCKEVRNMRASTTTETVIERDGKKKRITTHSFHCGHCSQFVRSENHEEVIQA